MAAITFNAAHQAGHVRERLGSVVTSLRETLDAFVSYRMRLTVAAAEHARPAAAPGRAVPAGDRAMIAMQLTNPDLSSRQAPRYSTAAPGRESEHPGSLPAGEPATVTAQFQPLDPDIVSEAIPAFFIGRNKEGFWVARDVKGRIGGVFLFETSALSFARTHSRPTGCATIFPRERFELDLENEGNPFIPQLRWLMQLAMLAGRRTATVIGGFMEAVKRRLQDFHIP